MKKIHQDVWCGAFLLVFAAFAYFSSLALAAKSPSSVVLPRLAIAMIAIFGVMILIDGFRKTRDAAARGELPKQFFKWEEMKVPLKAFVFITAYIALFWCVGYMVATPIFMLAFMYHLKMRNWKVMILITVIFMAIVYFFFVGFLHVRLDNFGAISTYLLK